MENTKVQEQWSSPIPESRWRGFRSKHPGNQAFKSCPLFEEAQVSELENALEEHERKALGRLLARGNKAEIEVFIRTHGANPISDPQGDINVPIHVAKADVISLDQKPTAKANQAILNGDVVHVLFQAGEASRFKRGPLYNLNVLDVARELSAELKIEDDIKQIEEQRKSLSDAVAAFVAEGPLGPKQCLMIRAALRRVVQIEINEGRLDSQKAPAVYQQALQNQKILFFISRHGAVSETHSKNLRETFKFYGFNPQNLVTVEQELVHGITTDEDGKVSLLREDFSKDAAGHLYAFLQAARPGDFTTYSESGRPMKPMEIDGLGYLIQRGGHYLNIVRINDMDRHSTEIINPLAISYALEMMEKGFVNVIEGVSNPGGQKGGTGTAFGDPEIHVLTETHENSYPVLSRAMEEAMKTYLEKNAGRHPAYNAMRQIASLSQTRSVLKEFGARLVFVPRQKKNGDKEVSYIGVDMPMGDLSLFVGHYKSRMFQFSHPNGKELLIHDMKKKENVPVAVRTLLWQLKDPYVIAAAKELVLGESVSFDSQAPSYPLYGAPTPEFD